MNEIDTPPLIQPNSSQTYPGCKRRKLFLAPVNYSRRLAPVFLLALAALVASLVLLLGLAQPLLAAGPHYVAPTGVDSANCILSAPCQTIQRAIDNAASGDEIRVAAGIYTTSGPQVVNLNKNLTLRGGFTTTNWLTPNPALNPTIIDAQGGADRRGIYVPNGVVATVSGFHVRGGNIIDGAGIYNQGNLTLVNSQIYNNTANGNGGGIYNQAVLTLRNSRVYSNSATAGGGLASNSIGAVLVEAVEIFSNTSLLGGGVHVENSPLTVRSSLIYINNATFLDGGGVFVQSGNVKLENNTIYRNATASQGGGVYVFNGTVAIVNSLIVSNTAVVDAGGIFEDPLGSATLNVTFTDFFGNSPNDGVTAGSNNRTNQNPQFINPPAFDLHLPSSGSPALDSGTNVTTAGIDFDGEGRPFNTVVDRGADEYTNLSSACYARPENGPVFTNIQQAVDAASAGSTVQVAGNCVGTQVRNGLQQTVYLSKSLTIRGGYTVTDWLNASYGPAILDANAAGRVVYITGTAAVTLDSLHITDGSINGPGAGVYLGGSGNAKLQNIVIYDNTATGGNNGGGVYQTGGPALLQHNTIYANTAAQGGGVYANSGTVTMRNSIVANNTATTGGTGGGVHRGSGNFVLSYNNFDGNTPTEYGNVTPGATDLSTAPGFVNPATSNFHLQYTSNLINAADPASTLATDFEADSRPQGTRADVGADESLVYPSVALSDGPGQVFTDVTMIQGTTITFNHTITNTGNNPGLSDTFNLSLSNSHGWTANLVGISSPVSLASGASQSFQVVVTVPPVLTGTIYNQTFITATSQANASTFDTTVDLIANPGVILAPSYTQNADPGTILTYTHTMTNIGPVSDTFVIDLVSDQIPPWGLLVAPTTTVTLEPNTSIQVTVVVSVPLSSEAGLAEHLQVIANSTRYPGVSGRVTDTTTANAIYGDRYVSTTGNDTINNCRDLNKPCRTVKRALEQVVGVGSTVRVATGTYNEADLSILKTITLQGGWNNAFNSQALDPALTIIDAGSQGRVIQIGNSSAVQPIVEYLTLSGGRRTGGGGGVYVEGSASPTLRYLIVRNSQATDGGGIYNSAGTLTLQNSQIYNNRADTNGGGLYNAAGTLRVQDNRIHDNQATNNGGGLYNHTLNGTLVVTKSQVYSNTAGQIGGGVNSGSGTLLMENNFVYSNTATSGGGTAIIAGLATLEHNSLYANRASSGTGGGIWLNGGTTTLNNTVVANHTGSGIHRSAGTVSQDYNDVYQNSGGNYVGLSAGPNSLAVDPGFENVAVGNLHLRPDSLILDRGNPASLVKKDIDNDDRPSDQGPDMGADELTGCRAKLGSTIYLVLQEAVDAATTPGATILVHGTCRGVHPLNLGGGQILSQTVHLTKNVIIQGGWNFDFSQWDPFLYPTSLDARGLGRTVLITGTTATLEYLNFYNGNATVAGGPNGGGGFYLVNADPTLRSLAVYSNTAGQGAGLYSSGSDFILQDSFILSNTASSQGGGLFTNGGNPVVERNRLRNNQAVAGGGLYHNSGTLTLRNNFIYFNSGNGGNGGGFYNAASATALHNTFYINVASTRGGGIYNAGSSLDVRSNIFAENSAGNDGGALYNAGTATFAYNDTWNNSANQVAGVAGTNNINADPQFVDAINGDLHLIPGSPAIDTADPTITLADDIDFDPRPSNQGFDMGADEQAGCYASLASAPAIVYGSVQVAVNVASPVTPDTVRVAGLCQGVQGLAVGGGSTMTQTVLVTKNITLQGGWIWDPSTRQLVSYDPNNRAILDALTLGRVLLITNSATVVVENFAIRSGNAGPGGGSNTGGGIYNYNGSLTVRNTVFYSNTAVSGSGGALYNRAGSLTLQASEFHDNSAANGGAVYLAGGTQVLSTSVIYSNTATSGGAVYLGGGAATVQTNRIHRNGAGNGAAIYHASSTPATVQNNFIYRNTATGLGGGFYNASGNPLIRHNTFYGNQAPASGGGGLYSAAGTPNINSTLVISNINIGLRVAGGSATVRYSDFFGNSGGDISGPINPTANISADPLFRDAANEDFHLFGITSPAWDKGDPAGTLLVDFDGDARPNDQGFDMGADEVSNCFARTSRVANTIFGNPQAAVDASLDDDVVDIAGTCYGVRLVNGTNQTLYLSKTLTIRGGWNTSFTDRNPVIYPTVLHALGQGRVLYITGGLAETPDIADLILRNGNAGAGNGGGIYNDSRATLIGLTVYSSTAANGGGIYNNSDLRLENSVIYSNTATSGGGGIYNAGGAPEIKRNQIHNNQAPNGAGIYVASGGPRIWNNIIRTNVTNGGPNRGGGFYVASSGAIILNNTIYGNVAPGQGGGIYVASGSPDLRNLIVDSNSAGSGGGIYVAGGSPTLRYNDVSRSLIGGNYAPIADPTGTNGNISADPLFASEATFNFSMVTPLSPAVDAGDPNTPPFVDQDYAGIIRPTHQEVDMGAYELGGCYARTSTLGPTTIFGSPQRAIDLSSAGATVDIAGICFGVHRLVAAGTVSQTVHVTKNLTIRGGWRPDFSNGTPDPILYPTILDALDRGRVLYLDGGTVDILGLTLRNGDAIGLGGGAGGLDAGGCVYIAAGTPAFRGSINIRDCRAGLGGGLYNVSSNFIMYNTGIYDSFAQQGGGFYNAAGSPELQNMLFSDNIANDDGGGVYVAGGSPEIWHINFVDNRAIDRGGAIYNASSGTLILNNIFEANTANEGGGLYDNTGGAATVDYSDWWFNDDIADNGTADSNVLTGTNSLSVSPDYVDPPIHLNETSLLIDAGSASPPPFLFDGDLQTRPQISGFDIGLDEVPQRVTFSFDPDRDLLADPCQVLTTTHTLSNNGNVGDTYTITLQSDIPDWGNQLLPADPQVVTLNPGESVQVSFQISPPCDAPGGLVNTSILQATSASTLVNDTVTDRTTIRTTFGVEIDPTNFGAAAPGQTITYTHLVTNLGNITDTFGVSLSSDYSNPVVTPTTLTLGPNVSQTITVSVTILDWPAAGLIDIVDVVAYKLDDQAVQDAAADHTLITGTTGVRYVAVDGSNTDAAGVLVNNCTDLVFGACATIQHAINQAAPGDEIWISSGVYTDVVTATVVAGVVDQTVYIDKPVTLRGGYNAALWSQPPQPITYPVTLDPAGQGRAVYVSQNITPTGPITLEWLTLRNGDANGFGGGPGGTDAGGNLYNEGADLTLSALQVAEGRAVSGGGLYSGGGALSLQNNLLYNSQATNGGALYLDGGSATLQNNTFHNNDATQGSAIYVGNGNLAGTNTIVANHTGGGPAVFEEAGSTITLNYNLYHNNAGGNTNGGVASSNSVPLDPNPQFVDPAANPPNLRLQSSSPAVDRGDPGTTLAVDFENDPRPLGLRADLGADERVPTQSLLFYDDTLTTTLAPSTVVVTHTLENQGDLTDTFTIDAVSTQPGWVTFEQPVPYLITLGPGISQTVVVTYAVPVGANGQTNVTVMTATSSLPTIFDTVTDIINVSSAAWQISKTVDPSPTVQAGGRLTYTLLITNVGDLDSSGTYTITDPLPANTTFVSATGSPVLTSPMVTWVSSTPVVSNGGTISFSYVVAVDKPLTDGTPIVNQNYAIQGGGAFTQSTGVPVTVTVEAPATLTISKSANPSPVQPGDYITYTITVSNDATALGPALGVIVSDTLPAEVIYQSMGFVSPATGTITDTGNPRLLWQLTDPVQPGASAQVTVTGRVNSPLGPTILTNSFGLTATNLLLELAESITTAVTPVNTMTLIKTVVPTRTLPGGLVTYTITLSNTGNGIPTVTLTDTLAPGFSPSSYITNVVVPGRDWNTTEGVATVSFTATAPITVGVYPNPIVTATFDLTDTILTDTAPVTVEAPIPAISLSKEPDNQVIQNGDPVTFTFTITNIGEITLTNIVVADPPVAPACDNAALPDLAVGQSTTYTCTVLGITADLTNTAIVSGTPPAGAVVTATDTAFVDIIGPAITIAKTPDSQVIQNGDPVTFTITVSNTGDVDLTGISVTDPLAPTCDSTTIPDLSPNESDSYTCIVSNVTSPFTNTAIVTGTPPVGAVVTDTDTAVVDLINPAITLTKTPDSQDILSGDTVTFTISVTNTGNVNLTGVTVSDALTPDCDNNLADLTAGAGVSYTCTLTNVTADFVNTAIVTGTPPVGAVVTATDTALVNVLQASIELAKTPASQIVRNGDPVTFTLTVTNTGDVTLTTVSVVDPLAPVCDNNLVNLGPGASNTYTCTLPNVTAAFTNTAVVTGTPTLGGVVTDTASAVVGVINPALAIAKTPDSQAVQSGGVVTFTISVTNTGDITLTNVNVLDTLAPNCNTNLGTLAAGAAATAYTCTVVAGTTDFTNTATVAGAPPVGAVVTATDTAFVDVIQVGLQLAKTPDTQAIRNGDTVTFTLTVTNTSEVTLTGVVVGDPLAPTCNNNLGVLAAGNSASYTCTQAGVTADFTNTAVVTGTPPVGPLVTATDTAFVDVLNPAITVAKTPDNQMVQNGDSANFTIQITNTGDALLAPVTVTDPLAPACDRSFPSLAAGAVQTYNCAVANVTGNFTNTVAVTGTPAAGAVVTATDTASVIVINPALAIAKTPDSQTVRSGTPVVFTITVTNTGDVALTPVTITDPVAPACNTTLPFLLVSSSSVYTCTMIAGTVDFTNTAVVTGTPPAGAGVTANDTAFVDVQNPAITIAKLPASRFVLTGSTITFTISVTNSGDVPLTGVSITDALVPACDNAFAALAIGENQSYTCTVPNVTASLTNTVVATATPPLGAVVTGTAMAVVIVEEPVVGLSAVNDSPTLLGQPTTLTATVTGGSNVVFTWDFGDGFSGTGPVLTHTYLATGTYTAIVTANNSVSLLTTTTTVTIVDVPITGLSAFNDSPTLIGQPTTLTATVTGGSNVVYTWDLGDNSSSSGAVVTHTYPATGTYTALVTASNSVSLLTTTTVVTITGVPNYAIYMPITLRDFGATPPPPPTGPDLVVTDITLIPNPGGDYTVRVTAQNQATTPVTFGNNFHVNLYLDGDLNNPAIIWGVQASWFGAGQSVVLEANYTFSSGTHDLLGWADPYNVVVEADENNNTRTLSGVVTSGGTGHTIPPSQPGGRPGPLPTPTSVP